MATTIEVNKQSVKQLLETGKSHPFVIPEYQRPYEWTDEQIVTLFEDLWDFISTIEDDNQSTYFLGSVVSYENKNGEQEIIDGQQRITSLFLLLRAIYTKLSATDTKTREAQNFMNQIEPAIWRTDKFTGEVDFSDILLKSQVINNKGNEILKNILKTGYAELGATDNYSKNYNKFLELYTKKAMEDPLKIYEFIYVILNQAILLPITADTQDTALTIFSTLNDRGLPLSDADIFKAKIYNNLEADKKSVFIEQWKELDEKASCVGENIQQLFYYYMFFLRAKSGDDKTTTPGVRKYFGENKFKRLDKTELLDDLKTILNIWTVVNKHETIDGEKWSEKKEIRKILDILNSYPNEFWKYPVVIYYLSYREKNNFAEEFLLFLRKLLVELLTKYLEIPTINAVKSNILKLDVEIIRSSKPIFDFKEVNEQILEERIKNPHRNAVRMLLKLIAYQKQDKLLPEKWEIEHILPQRWQSTYFTNISEAIIKEKIEHIGNKIPFEKRLNIIAGNGYFDKKKSLYLESEIAITKNFAKIDVHDWNLDSIAERDIYMVDMIQNILKQWNMDYSA